MADVNNPGDNSTDAQNQSGEAVSERRPYEAPKLVSGDIFERVVMTSATAPNQYNPAC